jgi:hypothetical protein
VATGCSTGATVSPAGRSAGSIFLRKRRASRGRPLASRCPGWEPCSYSQFSGETLGPSVSASRPDGRALAGGGNHRGSIFRLLVGEALLQSGSFPGEIIETWGRGNTANARVRESEQAVERAVSAYIRSMPLLWVAIDDAASRALVERNSIALISNRNREAADLPSVGWLGRRSSREAVRQSGLWNIRETDVAYSRPFLELFEREASATHHQCRMIFAHS